MRNGLTSPRALRWPALWVALLLGVPLVYMLYWFFESPLTPSEVEEILLEAMNDKALHLRQDVYEELMCQQSDVTYGFTKASNREESVAIFESQLGYGHDMASGGHWRNGSSQQDVYLVASIDGADLVKNFFSDAPRKTYYFFFNSSDQLIGWWTR